MVEIGLSGVLGGTLRTVAKGTFPTQKLANALYACRVGLKVCRFSKPALEIDQLAKRSRLPQSGCCAFLF